MRCLIVLVLLSGTAFAQAPGVSPTVDPMFIKEVDPPEGPPKNLLSAYLITVASVSVPVALSALSAPDDGHDATALQNAMGVVGVAGMLLGPTAGHWYAGEGVTTGLALRLTAAAGFGAIAIGDPGMNHLGVWIVGGITCVGVYEAGFIWDLVTLPRSVRQYNKRYALRLAPMATTSGSGLSLAGTF